MRLVTAALMSLAVASTLSAQLSTRVDSPRPQMIDPGMTRAQVVDKLGEPLSVRVYENFTYLLYRNGCEKRCGMNDLVVLDSGKVVDAVFRSPTRRYSGMSSSPRMLSAEAAQRGAGAPPLRLPAKSPATNVTPKKPAY
jgi:hypothetical protein